MSKFYTQLLMIAYAMGAMAYDPTVFSGEKRSHFVGGNIKVKRTPEPTLHVYSIHGEKITARDRKTAIKIHNLKHK